MSKHWHGLVTLVQLMITANLFVPSVSMTVTDFKKWDG